jgi:AcrR family transcriptional regulator
MSKEEELKERILVEANQLFMRFGLKKTTMDDIAKSVGMAKSSLYYYFKNKDDVFESVLVREMDLMRVAVDAEVRKQATLEDKLITHNISFHEQVLQRENLYRIVKSKGNNPVLDQNLQRIVKREVEYVKNLVTYGMVSGEITSIQEDEVGDFAELMVAALFGMVQYVFDINKGFDKSKFEHLIKIMIPRLL